MRGLAYPDLAIRVLTPFLGGEIEPPVFERLVREAYATFRHEAVCPLVQTGAEHASSSSCSTARRWPSRTWRCSCWRG